MLFRSMAASRRNKKRIFMAGQEKHGEVLFIVWFVVKMAHFYWTMTKTKIRELFLNFEIQRR